MDTDKAWGGLGMSLAWMQMKPIGLGRPGYESSMDADKAWGGLGMSLAWMQMKPIGLGRPGYESSMDADKAYRAGEAWV